MIVKRKANSLPLALLRDQDATVTEPSRSPRSSAIAWRAPRLLCWVAGLSLLLWAILAYRFRATDGFPTSTFCFLISASVGLLVLGSTVHGGLRRLGFWFALGLVGQAAALQLIDAGPTLHYQHYRPFDRPLDATDQLALTLLAAQAMAVALGLYRRWPKIRAWIGSSFKVWQIVGVGLFWVVAGSAAQRVIPLYLQDLLVAVLVQSVSVGNVILIVWAIPDDGLDWLRRSVERLFGKSGAEAASPRLDRFALVGAVWVVALAAALSVFVYQRFPHIQDEVIYLYQARYFAHGALSVRAAPVPEAFSLYMIPFRSARWYSPFPPGWPAMLALGVLAGVPWLINPLLAGLNVVLASILVRDLYDLSTARIVVLLLCICPWNIFMAMNLMSHTFVLTCSLIATVAMVRARWSDKPIWGGLAGCMIGMVSLIRPLDGVLVGGLLGLWAIGIGGKRLRIPVLGAFVLGIIVVGGLILPYNRALTGSPTVLPLESYYEQYFGHNSDALGFGPDRGLNWPLQPFPGYSPVGALINAALNVFSLNVELLGWGTGSLLLAALLVSSGVLGRSDRLMLAVIVANAGLYSLYWFNGGPDFGARYWYLMLIPLVVLTARGLQFLGKALESSSHRSASGRQRVYMAMLALGAFALMNYFPWRATDKYYHYLQMQPGISSLAQEYKFGKSLILVHGDSFPDYASAWTYNPLDLHADEPVFAWAPDPGTESRVLKAYPDRPVWIVDGPSLTGHSFRVVAGPLSSQDLLRAEGGEK